MLSNEEIANRLEEIAELLEVKGENPYRIQSYRNAARSVRAEADSVAELYRESGHAGLESIDNVGSKLAGAIAELVETEHLGLLDRLRTEVTPEKVFAQLPGIGDDLAKRIHDELEIDSLEELERAAHTGQLQRVKGIGRKKASGIRNALAGMLSRSARRRSMQRVEESGEELREPSIDLLLELDDEYRRKAETDELRRIAPKRFNPDGEQWLPIMETEREGWDFTLLFSNTKRAHDLDKTHDWVVIYYKRNGIEDQCTVVTATTGPLEGKRVIRGRERACRDYYAEHEAA